MLVVAYRLDLVATFAMRLDPAHSCLMFLSKPPLPEGILVQAYATNGVRCGGASGIIHEAALNAGRQIFIELGKVERRRHARI